MTLFFNGRPVTIPTVGTVSLWSSSELDVIDSQQQYTIRLLGRVLDQIYDIPIDIELTMGAMVSNEFDYSEDTEPAQGQLKGAYDPTVVWPTNKILKPMKPLNPSAPQELTRGMPTVHYTMND